MNDGRSFHITYLLDAPNVVPILALWFVEDWGPWYGPDGPGNAEDDLKACSSRDKLPLGLVALSETDDVLGTASLKSESVGSEIGAGPWLAAVLVNKDHQGEGIGTALVEAIENDARSLGFETIYTSTDTAGGIMKARQWEEFGTADSLRGPVTIYRKQLKGETT